MQDPGFANNQTPTAPKFDEGKLTSRIQELLEGKTNVETIRSALGTKYQPDQVNSAMRLALQPRIDSLLEKGETQSNIDALLIERGIISAESVQATGAAPIEGERNVLMSPEDESDIRQAQQLKGVPNNVSDVPDNPYAEQAPENVAPNDVPNIDDFEEKIILDQSMEATAAQLRQLTSSYERDFMQLGGVFSDDMRAKGAQMQKETNALITKQMQVRGHNVTNIKDDGTIVLTNSAGQDYEVDESMVDDMLGAKFELAAVLAGGVAGGKAAADAAKSLPPQLRLVKAITVPLGATVGAVMGAWAGSGADVTLSAMQLKYELSTRELLDKMNDAGTAELYLGIVGGTAITLAKGTIKGGKKAGRAISNLHETILQGNRNGAAKILRDAFGMNEAQIIEHMVKFDKLTGSESLSQKALKTGKLRGDDAAASLKVMALTKKNLGHVTGAALKRTEKSGAPIVEFLTKQAKDLTDAASEITNERIKVTIQDDLAAYSTRVGDHAREVREVGSSLMNETNYKFDFDTATMSKELGEVAAGLHNENLSEGTLELVQQLGKIGGKEGGENPYRNFSDLLNLRGAVNKITTDFKLNNYGNQERVNAVMASIDSEINRAVKSNLGDDVGKAWLKDWSASQTEWGNRAGLKSELLFKMLTKKEVKEEAVIKAFGESAAYSPDVYRAVLSKLPPKTRGIVEGSVIKQLMEKATIGEFADGAAIDFIKLEKTLGKIAFTQPAARDLKRLVGQYAEVFRGNPDLLAVSGKMVTPESPSQPMGAVGGFKYAVARESFKWLKSRIPFSTNAKRRAVIIQLGKVLDDPLNAIETKRLLRQLPKDSDLHGTISGLAVKFASYGERAEYNKIAVYPRETSGEMRQFTFSKAGAKTQTAQSVHPSRLATTAIASRELGFEVTEEDLMDKNIRRMIKEKGYKGVATDNKMFLFKSNLD